MIEIDRWPNIANLDFVEEMYARFLDVLPGPDPLASHQRRAFQEAFAEWLDMTDALAASRPAAMESNSSKPYQAQLIAKAGFRIPETLVTNDPAALDAFRERHRRIVYKSVSGVRSIVQELTGAALGRVNRLQHLPVQFQELIEGVDVRVHVVGAECFATTIRSDSTDYRYAGAREAELVSATLPEDVAARCVALSRTLDLPLCGIDLRRTSGGEYVCFEANPMPAFSYFESHTGAPIANAVARLLLEARNGKRT